MTFIKPWPHRIPLGINWNTDCKPGLYSTSVSDLIHAFLTKRAQSCGKPSQVYRGCYSWKAEWAEGGVEGGRIVLGIGCPPSSYWCDVQVFTCFWPYSVCAN